MRWILAAFAALALAPASSPGRLTLNPCTTGGVEARCGALSVPENPWLPQGRRIDLNVVVIPALEQPARRDAFTYLAGGPGGKATSIAPSATSLWAGVHVHRDILLVDQRGTHGARAARATLYGTMTAADDLESVRDALGYRSLDLYGASYGATLAQAFVIRHPRSVRAIVLDGATLVSIPFYSRFAANGERALDAIAARCHDQPTCRAAFPRWRAQLTALIHSWNERPALLPDGRRISGDRLAGVIQSLTTSVEGAALVPAVVAHAARGDLVPLSTHVGRGGITRSVMFWSILCNEPWVGLDSRVAGSGYLTGFTRSALKTGRAVCSELPARPETPLQWRLTRSGVPVLALVGGADPQDPLGNLTGLHRHFPNSRIVVVPGMAHTVGQYGCLGAVVSRFVDRGGARGLDTTCSREIRPPRFSADA